MYLSLQAVRERVRDSAKTSVRNGVSRLEFHAMASPCVVSFAAAPTLAKAFQEAVLDWVADFEATYSRFIPENLISRINAKAGREWIDIDLETERLLYPGNLLLASFQASPSPSKTYAHFSRR